MSSRFIFCSLALVIICSYSLISHLPLLLILLYQQLHAEEYIQIPEEVEIQEVPHVEAKFDSEILNEVKAENFEEIQNENYNEVENIIDNPAKFTEKNDPMGLFSAVSGFGWENYFEPRLDSELVRAASSEQDVSLFMIKYAYGRFKIICSL